MHQVHIDRLNEMLAVLGLGYLDTYAKPSEVGYLSLMFGDMFDLESDVVLEACEYLVMVRAIIELRASKNQCILNKVLAEMFNKLINAESCSGISPLQPDSVNITYGIITRGETRCERNRRYE